MSLALCPSYANSLCPVGSWNRRAWGASTEWFGAGHFGAEMGPSLCGVLDDLMVILSTALPPCSSAWWNPEWSHTSQTQDGVSITSISPLRISISLSQGWILGEASQQQPHSYAQMGGIHSPVFGPMLSPLGSAQLSHVGPHSASSPGTLSWVLALSLGTTSVPGAGSSSPGLVCSLKPLLNCPQVPEGPYVVD